jgi:ornithine cyclodeaminase
MKIITLDEIKEILLDLDLIPAIEAGFMAYSAGRAVVPPVGELLLEKGEVHIKYGYIKNEDYYVIKVASGFYDNRDLGLPSSNGLMLLFSQETGQLVSILLDEGYLTDLRTAVAGAIAAKYLAPKLVRCIGIVGSGIQARQQLMMLRQVVDCRDVLVWGLDEDQLKQYQVDMIAQGYQVEIVPDTGSIMARCDLIVTCTPAARPLLAAADLRPGIHITAVGSDTPHKQEVEAAILAEADLIVADSIPQCLVRGEIYQALLANRIDREDISELGQVIAGKAPGRTNDQQITIADLTGVAVQDIGITVAVYGAAMERSKSKI